MHLRKSNDRGEANLGWLQTRYTFSFAEFYDPAQMGFGLLRVINEDVIQGGGGFDTHGHKNMEIISYLIEGALRHRDSMGNEAVIKAGDVQRMSAGTGVQHSEFNHLKDKQTHLLQIWIKPEKLDIQPSYEQKNFNEAFNKSPFLLVASQSGREGSISLNQDVNIYAGKSQTQGKYLFKSQGKRDCWIQVIRGKLQVNGISLETGDGLGIAQAGSMDLSWGSGTEFVFFDMISR